MPLTVEIVTPARKVFTSAADNVVLPAQAGQLGILPGHIPVIALLSPGEVVVTNGTSVEHLVIDKGFARVIGDTVSVLTEAAIDIADIDLDAVAKAEAEARDTLAAVRANGTQDDKQIAEMERLERVLQFSAVQKLYKRAGR